MRPIRITTVSLLVLATLLVPQVAAHAAIDASSTAADLASAISSSPGLVTGASFVAQPTQIAGGPPSADAVSTTALTSFPTNGASYAILTSGDATLADLDDATNGDPLASASYETENPSDVRGANDVTILQVDMNIPTGQTCLTFDFRFLSEEYQQYVGSFNDAFIAELDTNDWSVDPDTQVVTAPNDFARDPNGDIVSVNNTGVAGMSAANGAGTVYSGAIDATTGDGGATQLLTARTPITSGVHSLYLSIYDAGDHAYDSAAFVDNLATSDAGPAECTSGVVPTENADLAVSKDGPATASPGGDFDYTLGVTNQGPDANSGGFSVSDDLPGGVTFDADGSDPRCTADGQLVTCTNTDGLDNGGLDSFTVHVTVDPEASGTLENTATVTSNGTTDPNDANDTSSAVTTSVVSAGDVSLSKTSAPTQVTGGNDVGYPLTVTNLGGADATNIVATDQLPTGLSFVAASSSDPWACSGTTSVTCSLSTALASGASSTVTVIAHTPIVSSQRVVTNVADVTSDQDTTVGGNNHAETSTTIVPRRRNDASGYIPPSGGSINTGTVATGTDPTVSALQFPPGPGGVAALHEFAGATFCAGPCDGQAVETTVPLGYEDGLHPIVLKITWDVSVFGAGKASKLYKRDADYVVRVVPFCKPAVPGHPFPKAVYPCIAAKRVLASGDLVYRVLLLSTDPVWGKR